jgi:hypothetical protein
MPQLIVCPTQGPAMTTSTWLTVALTLLLSACNNPGDFFMSDEEDAPTVVVKEHPQPKRAYQLTMVIENAPGPFGMIEGSAQYDVINHKTCGERNPVSGTRSRISTHPPIAWKPIGNGQYVAMVYSDLIVDEDYYGNGICRWTLTAASALLRATGAETETRFLPGISATDILAERAVKLYFWGGGYPRSGMDNYPDFGKPSPDNFGQNIRHELFTVTLTAKEAQP